MIITVTPNPSVDKAIVIPNYRLGKIHRPQQLLALAGGKGLNVSRTIVRLGGSSSVRDSSWPQRRWMADRLAEEGIETAIVWGEGETRTSTSVIDPQSGQLTEIYEHGTPVSSQTWQRFEAVCEEAAVGARLAVFSGSLPPGAPEDGYARLARRCRAAGASVLIDTHGPALQAAVKAQPALVKINAAEATAFVGSTIESWEGAVEAAVSIHRSGIETVITTLGKQGAVAVNELGKWIAEPPAVEAIAPVSSGDAMLGGLALELVRGRSLVDALRPGVAAGAANATTLGVSMS